MAEPLRESIRTKVLLYAITLCVFGTFLKKRMCDISGFIITSKYFGGLIMPQGVLPEQSFLMLRAMQR